MWEIDVPDLVSDRMHEIVREVMSRMLDEPDPTVKIVMSQVIAGYCGHLATLGRRTTTVRQMARALKASAHRLGWTTSHDIDAAALEAGVAAWLDAGMARSTVNGDVQRWRRVSRWLATRGMIERDRLAQVPAPRVNLHELHHRSAYMVREEVAAIIAAAEADERAWIEGRPCKVRHHRSMQYRTIALSGLRVGEVARSPGGNPRGGLIRQDIDLDRGVIRVRSETTKRCRPHIVPLHPDLARHMRYWLATIHEPDALVFDRRVSRRCWQLDLQAAGLSPIDPQSGLRRTLTSLRKYFITELARAGVDQTTRNAITGHTTLDLAERHYIDMSRLRAAEAVNLVPGVDSRTLDVDAADAAG